MLPRRPLGTEQAFGLVDRTSHVLDGAEANSLHSEGDERLEEQSAVTQRPIELDRALCRVVGITSGRVQAKSRDRQPESRDDGSN